MTLIYIFCLRINTEYNIVLYPYNWEIAKEKKIYYVYNKCIDSIKVKFQINILESE